MNTFDMPLPVGQAGRTALNWRVLAICFFVTMVDGFDTMMLAFLAPLIGHAFALQPAQIGQLFGAGYFGAVLGAMLVGPLADRFGRRAVLLCALVDTVAFTWLCAQADSAGALMGWRFVAGLGLGAAVPTVIALTAESMPASHRSRAVTWMFLGFPLGAVVGGALTAVFLSHGWRTIFQAGALAALLMIPLVWWALPEAPWRAPAGQGGQKARSGGPFASLAAQFADGRTPAALLLWLGVFCIMVVTYFLVSWMPSVVVRAGFSPEKAAVVGVLMNLGGIVGACVISQVLRHQAPWRLVALSFMLGAFVVGAVGWGMTGLPLTLLLVFMVGLLVFGAQLNIPALAVQLFPPRVRGAGTGWTMGVGRLGSIVGPIAGGHLLGAGLQGSSLFAAVAVLTFVAGICLLLAARLRPVAPDEQAA